MLTAQTIARRAVKRSRTRELHPFHYANPADFLEAEMVIPETGRPITLHPEQRAVIEALLRRDGRGNFLYDTIVYSSIKKSAKTTLCAGLMLWQGWQIADGQVYIVGNDLRQADNRMAQAMRYAVQHNPRMAPHAKINNYKMELSNGTKIESIPVDPAGEAGMNPTAVGFTEAWGARQTKHVQMWTEAQLSPTPGRVGKTFRLVESYAGYTGDAPILEPLYQAAVKPENVIDPTISPQLYAVGKLAVYWNTRRFLPWQLGEDADAYYAEQARVLHPDEYRRVHQNEWVSSSQTFVPLEWWRACQAELPPEGSAPWVLSADAAVSGDCFGLIGLTRHGDKIAVRYARAWHPPQGGKIDFNEPLNEIRRLCKERPVIIVVYDEYQLHYAMSQLSEEGIAWFYPFSQGAPRLVSDKALYDLIAERNLIHSGEPDLAQHIANANAEIDKQAGKLRIVKRAEDLHVDLAVALAMGAARALDLNIG